MRKICLLLFLMAIITKSFAQYAVKGNIKGENNDALGNISITLKKAIDSSIVKIELSNNSGDYTFNKIAKGKYFITYNSVNFTPQQTPIFEILDRDITMPQIVLVKLIKQLEQITVTAKKPLIEVKADKTVLNIENSINAVGNDAIELLRKAPGVTIDKDDNLSLSGKNGVQVFIDGRPTPLSGKELADYLRTIQSTQIETIEIITNPSAKYDAAGNAGIINIKLKKNKAYGTNGSVNANYAIGTYSKYNTGISLNNRSNKLNFFGNYTFNTNKNLSNVNFYRTLLDTLFDQRGFIISQNEIHSFKTGFDYFINKKNTFGVIATGSFTNNSNNNFSQTPITYTPTNLGYRLLIADNKQSGSNNNMNVNLNYHYSDTLGRDLNVDGNYGFFKTSSDQYQPNYYMNFNGTTELFRTVYNMVAPSKITIANFKADYEQNFKKGRLSYGAKISWVKSEPSFERYNVYSNTKVYDSLRSNQFQYTENINAAYLNYNRQYKGLLLQLGIRVENTSAKGISNGYQQKSNSLVKYDSAFERNYTNLFPSASLTLNKNPNNQWSFSFSRRIDRPAYPDLNPFEFKLDEYTYQKGNTQLLPQYTNSFSITNIYKYKLTSTLNYSHVSDVFGQLIDTTEQSKSFITKKNLATQNIISFNISMPFQWKWYSLFANLNANYSNYKADFGKDRIINLDAYSWNIYSQHSIKLGKGYTGEINAWYSAPGIWQGTIKGKAMGSVDVGLQKSVLKGNGNLKLTVSDIFFTMKWGGESRFAGQTFLASGNWESRQLKLNFSYRFGKNTVKAARQRKTGIEDESNRVQNSGGLNNN